MEFHASIICDPEIQNREGEGGGGGGDNTSYVL